MKFFFEIFEKIETDLVELTELNSLNDRKNIDIKVASNFINLRIKFYDPFFGIDKSLYKNVQLALDQLQGVLSENIFNENLDFKDKGVFQSEIIENIIKSKTRIIELLYVFNKDV